MMYEQLYTFIDQLGFELLAFVFTIVMTAILFGLASKSFLHD